MINSNNLKLLLSVYENTLKTFEKVLKNIRDVDDAKFLFTLKFQVESHIARLKRYAEISGINLTNDDK